MTVFKVVTSLSLLQTIRHRFKFAARTGDWVEVLILIQTDDVRRLNWITEREEM